MKGKKAQISVEVMAYISFLILVFVLFSFYLLLNFNSEIKNRQYLLLREEGEQIAQYFLFVLNSGPGTTFKFSVKPYLSYPFGQKSNFSILISNKNGWLYIVTKSSTGTNTNTPWFSFPIGFKNFVCNPNQPPSLVPSCKVNGQTIEIDPSKGWIFLNYTSNKIEVE
ncbi:MAG: hypothetical protein ACK4J0_00105 [Candidatus Anstonellaceae archaeon]